MKTPGIKIKRQTRLAGVWTWECEFCPAKLHALSYFTVCKKCVVRSAVAHILTDHLPKTWLDSAEANWWWSCRDEISSVLSDHPPHLEAT